MKLRTKLAFTTALLCLLSLPLYADDQSSTMALEPHEVVYKTVLRRAEDLAKQEYQKDDADEIPELLRQLNYDEYKAIHLKKHETVWRNERLFEIQPLHPGFIFNKPVMINITDQNGINRSLHFNKDQFIYGSPATHLRDQPFETTAYSGFRVLFPLNSSSHKDEILVFQGASYFRLLSQGQSFGLSARGVAVNTANADGEEFPYFSEFWLLQPHSDDHTMYVFALLNSPSLTGAYQFALQPGYTSKLDIKMNLFARNDIQKLGIAPLTSMFLLGENSETKLNEFRKQIHDSDGLQIQLGNNQWIWRPLTNPKDLSVVSFQADDLKGYGLMQRDDQFDNYLDAETFYHKRPSYWVTPGNNWEGGRIELVEIPTQSETNDNIVAYWVANEKLKKGKSIEFKYTLSSVHSSYGSQDLARVIRTRIGENRLPGFEAENKKARRFVIDFSGDAINNLSSDAPIKASIESTHGKISDIEVKKLPDNLGWRLTFVLDPSPGETSDMRANLLLRQNVVTEVWTYVWSR